MKQDLLRVDNIFCGYGKEHILREIGFNVSKGELLGIIGPNGSGKTTLLRAIARTLRPTKGQIFLEGQDIQEIPLKTFAQKTAVVSQTVEPVLMTVEEYVILGRLPYFRKYQFFETKGDEEIINKYMALTDTVKLKDSLMCDISGGERQLASIAHALAQEPLLLLLDEPTAHLDIYHQVQILELINRLNRQLGLTVLMVLHDLNLASEYCNRLILLNEGSIARTGTPEEVITYQVIEEVYRTLVMVQNNPLSGKPSVFLVTKDDLGK